MNVEKVIGLIAMVIFFLIISTPLWILIIGFIGCYIEKIQEQKKFNDEIKKQEAERKYWDWLLSPEQIEKRRLEKLKKEKKGV